MSGRAAIIFEAARWTLGLEGRSVYGRRLRAGIVDAAAVLWLVWAAQQLGAI